MYKNSGIFHETVLHIHSKATFGQFWSKGLLHKILINLEVTSIVNLELWKSGKLYLRNNFIELVFLFVCPLAHKTQAN